MSNTKRNCYIDVIKFVFSLIILEFHLNSGYFKGGRVAVEGFFMISAYLMMGYISREKHPKENLGISTVRFITHKYKALFPYLLPSLFLGNIVYAIRYERTLAEFIGRLPLLLFDLIPLCEAGFRGSYVLGISWYLSSMFLSLAILFPLCRKYRSSFTLIVCPLSALLIYGYLSHIYGHLAIACTYIEGIPVSAGLLRGFAGSALGCFLYEICIRLKTLKPTGLALVGFSGAEILGFTYLFYAMHTHPKSQYDYVLIFLIFCLLAIGISGLSVTSLVLNPRYTKPLGVWSTLIVLNHCCWRDYLPEVLGTGYQYTFKAIFYYSAVFISCLNVYILSRLLEYLFGKCRASKKHTINQ